MNKKPLKSKKLTSLTEDQLVFIIDSIMARHLGQERVVTQGLLQNLNQRLLVLEKGKKK